MNNTLAEFQSYLSESFFRRINLLEKIIGNRHWLTTGTYKEKVLLGFLNDTLPNRLAAQSGFIVFPCEKQFRDGERPEDYDYLNSSSYDISKQIDIIVYDQQNFSPILNDRDTVILGPESVRAVIEVKGRLSPKHLEAAVITLNDFIDKWSKYKEFRSEHYLESKLPSPSIYIFAWETKTDKKNKRSITGTKVREILARNLQKTSSKEKFKTTPAIRKASVYNDYEVDLLHHLDADGPESVGYMTDRGRYIIFDENGNPNLSGDKTIYSLLRDILVGNDLLLNRFLIDSDETNVVDILPHRDSGYSKAFDT